MSNDSNYSGKRLIALEHPTQSEHYGYDQRGLKVSKTVTLKTPGAKPKASLTAITRYHYDEAGTLQGATLADGSQLVYERDRRDGQGSQGQIVALKRRQLQTPWLQRWASWMLPEQTLATGLQRDMIGLKSYTAGNGIEAQYQRSQNGALARIVYRHTKPPKLQTASNHQHQAAPLSATAQEAISWMLGIRPAHASEPVQASKAGPEKAPLPGEASKNTLPGALSLPTDPQALIDHRYLWSAQGNLLYTESKASRNTSANTYANTYAYDS